MAGTVQTVSSRGDALSRSTAVTSDHRNTGCGHNLETFPPSSGARFGWKFG